MTAAAADAEGNVLETVDHYDGMLSSWWTTAPDGTRWFSVYRSYAVRDTDGVYAKTLKEVLANDLNQVAYELVPDPGMWNAKAELALWL